MGGVEMIGWDKMGSREKVEGWMDGFAGTSG